MVKKISLMTCLSFLLEEKGENMEPHGVSKISISAQSGSNISAPVLLNSTVTGNINISNNFFPGEWKYLSLLVEMLQPNTAILILSVIRNAQRFPKNEIIYFF